MRRFLIVLVLSFFAVVPLASAKGGRVIKVLPEFLDVKGRNAVSPSLYERDAYQSRLRKNPKLRSGLGFFVQWKTKDVDTTNLILRVEMRGVQGSQLQSHSMEQSVKESRWSGWFGTWSVIKFDGEDYKSFGDLVAWRVSLWNDGQLLSEQKSFLW